ncbi:MAG: hypothetical protein M0Z28_03810 [Rhodospirillales bacterium]|nr:hypothetical protein [Rhodospirillales bacterium]
MNTTAPAFGCGADRIQFDVASTRILGLVAEKLGVEEVPLVARVGRVIAASWGARSELSGFDQSRMDAYVVRRLTFRRVAVWRHSG